VVEKLNGNLGGPSLALTRGTPAAIKVLIRVKGNFKILENFNPFLNKMGPGNKFLIIFKVWGF